ncbi:CxxxxCH/CxxCH domain-containing protein, partial [Spirochaetota bacterium]
YFIGGSGASFEPLWDESLTNGCSACHNPVSGQHISHVGAGSDCTECHFEYTLNVNHSNFINDMNNSFSIVNFDSSNNSTTWVNLSNDCSNISCHGGSPVIINWYNPVISGCSACHVPDSGSHPKHVTAGYSCIECHDNYESEPTHRNGAQDSATAMNNVIAFNSTLNPDGSYNSGTCSSLLCHGSALDPLSRGTDITPEWGDSASGTCGTCHKIDSTLSSGGHSAHLSAPASYTCDKCHNDGPVTTEHHSFSNMTIDGSVQVVFDGTVPSGDFSSNKCTNIYCHGNFIGGNGAVSEPGWNDTVNCTNSQCHGNSSTGNPANSNSPDSKHGTHINMIRGIANPATDNNYTEAETCSVCHYGHGNATATHLNGQVDITFNYNNPEGSMGSVDSGGDYNSTTTGFNSVICSNTYCHGNFSGGSTYTVDWSESTGDPGWCGSCHSNNPTSVKHSEHLSLYPGQCGYCHLGYTSSSAPENHVSLKKDVLFGYPHPPGTGGDPSYDNSTKTCLNLYCHGNFPIVNYNGSDINPANNASPTWQVSSTAACGSCHGDENSSYSSATHGEHTNPNEDVIPFFGDNNRIESCDACHSYGDDTSRAFDFNSTQGSYNTVNHANFSINNSGVNIDVMFKADNGDLASRISPLTQVNAHTTWDVNTTTCSNSWCHGNFSNGSGITGNNADNPNWLDRSSVWTGPGCTTSCHGDIHTLFSTQCMTCHESGPHSEMVHRHHVDGVIGRP